MFVLHHRLMYLHDQAFIFVIGVNLTLVTFASRFRFIGYAARHTLPILYLIALSVLLSNVFPGT